MGHACVDMVQHFAAVDAQHFLVDVVEFSQIVKLCRAPDFRPDCRWIATQAGVSVDEVNLALQRLLRLGLIELASDGVWRDSTGLKRPDEREFRRVALARVREKAAEDRVKLGKESKKNG